MPDPATPGSSRLQKLKRVNPREQPRRAASSTQLGDPRIYYYLAWASPPSS
jgi:hypothetical protein